jgi:hypothetical protein
MSIPYPERAETVEGHERALRFRYRYYLQSCHLREPLEIGPFAVASGLPWTNECDGRPGFSFRVLSRLEP